MSNYAYGYCGMPCALCTRYRTEGKSRCPGCSHDGYYTEPCKVYRCCKESKQEHCGMCKEYPCTRLGKMGDFSNLNTNCVKGRTGKEVSSLGFEHWYEDYEKKANLLTEALSKYNNGRMKRYLCELFIQQDLNSLIEIMSKSEILEGTPKEKGQGFQLIVQSVLKHKE